MSDEMNTLSFPRRREPIDGLLDNSDGQLDLNMGSRLRGNDISFSRLSNGIHLFIPKNHTATIPFHEIFQTEPNSENHIHNTIVISENAQAVFIEEHSSSHTAEYTKNITTKIFLEKNAQLHYYKIQNENSQAKHFAKILVTQKQDSVLKSFSLASGGKLAREDLRVELQERGASCYLNGLYQLKEDGQQIDNHLFVDHMAEHGSSSMLYKGILDKKSRAIFKGKVFVKPGAQKTNASQANHNLLLSNQSDINTKPELEIYADDVKCTHGATVGQLDAEALFYLQSRGVAQKDAQRILTQAFAEEIISKIEHSLPHELIGGLNEKL